MCSVSTYAGVVVVSTFVTGASSVMLEYAGMLAVVVVDDVSDSVDVPPLEDDDDDDVSGLLTVSPIGDAVR